MKILGYVWTVAINLVTLAVIWAVLSSAHTRFEGVVVCILVLIYVNINWYFGSLGRGLLEMNQQNLWRFIELAHLLKYPRPEVYLDAHKENAAELEASAIKFWINGAFVSVYAIGTIVVLISRL